MAEEVVGAPAGPRDTFVSVNNDTSCSLHPGRRTTGAAAGAVLPILGMYQSPPEARAGHVHVPPLKTARPS